MRKALGVRWFLATRVALVNSFWREVKREVHQGLDLEEGRERGAVASIVDVRALRAEENHWSRWLGDRVFRGGWISQSLSLLDRFGQSASCQRGLGLLVWPDGRRRTIIIGA